MKAELILKNYEIAKERYAALGVDTIYFPGRSSCRAASSGIPVRRG